jgi:6-phosphogluconolactonase/glucosamine-6-phosphate isomerase/deaminase
MLRFDATQKPIFTTTMNLHKPRILHFEANDQLNQKLENHIEDRIIEMSADYGVVRMAVSGGENIAEVIKIVGKNYSFPYSEMELYQTDENITTGENQKIIKNFIKEDMISELQNYSFFKIKIDPEDSAQDYIEETIDQLDDEDGIFDLVLLNIDSKGQIAGLISNGNGLNSNSETVVTNGDIATLSVQTILNSREIVVILKDEDDTLAEILEGQKKAVEFPAKFLLAHPNVTVFYHSEF